MFCKYCGKELEEGTKFCPYCGKMQEDSAVNDSVAAQNGINPNTIQPSNKLDSSNSLFKASKVLLIISLVFLSLVSLLVIISTILSAGLTLLAFIPFILALVFNSMGLSKLKKAKSVDELSTISILIIVFNILGGNIFGLIAGILMLTLKNK